jgi:predicted nucleic acid-binding protein
MGQQGFLIDTNIAIASLGKDLPPKGTLFVNALSPAISVITQIELLGWYGASAGNLVPIINFVDISLVYQLIPDIIQRAIILRQNHKIKTPDAIIAATALIHDLTLLTRNSTDFTSITGLKLINPYSS